MIRVLVVDDSAFMRKAIAMMLEDDPAIQVVDTARDGIEALDKVRQHAPDIVTMDVEMPRMDGIEAVRRIMATQPTPVLMISSVTREGAQATLDALHAGAVDFISKQLSFVSLEITQIKDELLAKVHAIHESKQHTAQAQPQPARPPRPRRSTRRQEGPPKALVIGVSTGGPSALREVIPHLPADLPVPVLVVQHMPPHFTQSLAMRLDNLSALTVREAEAGMTVTPGQVLIAPGGRHLVLRRGLHGIEVDTPTVPSTLHRPSVDILFQSAADMYGGRLVAAVLTGMGHDGLEGVREIKALGGTILAQDAASCVVYGMPRAIVEADLADAVVPLNAMATHLTQAVGASPASARVGKPTPLRPFTSRLR